jgi:hypothetical protein
MPNFGKVSCFRRFNVNSLNLQEVLVSGIRMKGITSIHNSRRLQKKVKNPSLPSIFLFTTFHRNGHFLVISLEKVIAYSRAIMGHILYYNTKLRSSGGAIFDQSGNFLSSLWNRTSIFSIER